MNKFQIEMKINNEASKQWGEIERAHSEMWFGRSDVAKQAYTNNSAERETIATTVKGIKREDVERQYQQERTERLNSNNMFTLVSLYYENPRDDEVHTKMVNLLGKLGSWSDEISALIDVSSQIVDDIRTRVKPTKSLAYWMLSNMSDSEFEDHIAKLVKQLPSERAVYRIMETSLNKSKRHASR